MCAVDMAPRSPGERRLTRTPTYLRRDARPRGVATRVGSCAFAGNFRNVERHPLVQGRPLMGGRGPARPPPVRGGSASPPPGRGWWAHSNSSSECDFLSELCVSCARAHAPTATGAARGGFCTRHAFLFYFFRVQEIPRDTKRYQEIPRDIKRPRDIKSPCRPYRLEYFWGLRSLVR